MRRAGNCEGSQLCGSHADGCACSGSALLPRSMEAVWCFRRAIFCCAESRPRRADVALAQALVEPAERLEQEALVHGGLLRLANLTYMERPVPDRNEFPEEPLPRDVRLERYRPEHRETLERLLVETYEDTLDCPGLAGLRAPADVVEGHIHSGIFRPQWWTIARRGDEAVGVALFNGSAGSSSIELVYLGLVPSARGAGLGGLLLRHGLRMIAGSRERNVVLAVDESNDPALGIYENHGFHRTIRRVAMVRSLAVDVG